MYVPIANVVRIMRRALPPHAKVADEAKEMFQECVSEFISFITSEANEACQLEHRKTITAEDVIGAMAKLGFDHFVEPLMMYLQKYRDSELLPPVQRRVLSHGANISTDCRPGFGATRFVPATNGLPPLAVIHPQYGMFGSAANGGYYHHDGSGPGSSPMNMTSDSDVLTTVRESNGPTLALGIAGLGGSEGAGSSQAGLGLHDPFAQ